MSFIGTKGVKETLTASQVHFLILCIYRNYLQMLYTQMIFGFLGSYSSHIYSEHFSHWTEVISIMLKS